MRRPGVFLAISLAMHLSAAYCQAQPGRKISAILETSPAVRSAFWGIEAVDLDTGMTVFTRDASSLFTPASNTKLFTAALALDRLGADFRFSTRVLSADYPSRLSEFLQNSETMLNDGSRKKSPHR